MKMKYGSGQKYPVVALPDVALQDDLSDAVTRAWFGWVSQQPKSFRADYDKNRVLAINAFTRMLATVLIDTMCPKLADGDMRAAREAVGQCQNKIVTTICQVVVPALREDLKRKGITCNEVKFLATTLLPKAES
jgi:hypothetical protein